MRSQLGAHRRRRLLQPARTALGRLRRELEHVVQLLAQSLPAARCAREAVDVDADAAEQRRGE
jgi:hypothetical protein